MQITRRNFLATGAGAITAAAAAPAFAAWEESTRYPDPRIQILDPSFARYRIAQSSVERLYTGARWGEGPVWMADWRCILWSDIPNNRILRWDEVTGRTSTVEKNSMGATSHSMYHGVPGGTEIIFRYPPRPCLRTPR